MPFSKNSELPKSVKDALPNEAQTVFRNVVNTQLERGLSEERSFASAWGTLKNQGWEKQSNGKWINVKKSNVVIKAQESGEDKDFLGLEFGISIKDVTSKGGIAEDFISKAEKAINEILEHGSIQKEEHSGAMCRFCECDATKIFLSSGGSILTYSCEAHIDEAVKLIVLSNQDSVKMVIDLSKDTDASRGTENESKIYNININGVPITEKEMFRVVEESISKALDKGIEKILKEEGDIISSVHGDEIWRDTWDKIFPRSGKGSFVYHHHFRSLTSEQVKMNHAQLHDIQHISIHGDLRLEADDSLYGIMINIGSALENKGELERFISGDYVLPSTFKLAQNKEWLKAGENEPLVIDPGESGSTPNSFAKMFVLDKGTYTVGVRTRSMAEIFLEGGVVRGRYLIKFALDNSQTRVWSVMKPKDQTPFIESTTMSKFAKDLRMHGHKRMVWAGPGTIPAIIDTNNLSEIVNKDYFFSIEKAEKKEDEQLITGIVMEPNVKDAHGDFQSAEEIKKASHSFIAKSRVIGLQHKKKGPIEIVESFISHENTKIGGQDVSKGSWIMTVKVNDNKIWKMVKAGDFTGFSIGGFAMKS